MTSSKRFVILSGPSCVGKGSLQRAVERLFSGMLTARPVFCHSRPPRAGETHGKDYYFLPPDFIRSLESSPDFVVSQVRSDWQAIHLPEVDGLLKTNRIVFAEAFYTFGQPLLQKAAAKNIPVSTVFLLPASPDTPKGKVIEMMRTKLKNRGTDTEKKREERATAAPSEVAHAAGYTHRLLNTAGEDDISEWGDCGTFGGKPGKKEINEIEDLGSNARWLVKMFCKIVKGDLPPGSYKP